MGNVSTMRFYVIARALQNQAVCSCGWSGKRRWFRGMAVSDAYLHGAEYGHDPVGAESTTHHHDDIVIHKTKVTPKAAIIPEDLNRVMQLRIEMGFYDPPHETVERFYDASVWCDATGLPPPEPFGLPRAI